MIINVLNTILMQFYFNNWKEIFEQSEEGKYDDIKIDE